MNSTIVFSARHLPRGRQLAALALGFGLSLGIAGCADDSTVSQPPMSSSAEQVDGISTEHNEADITFIRDMTPHHEGALSMAELAPQRASSDAVKDLAARIVAAQQPEIDAMAKMAKAWGVTIEDSSMGHGGGHSGGMDGDADTAALEPLSGEAFDKEFLKRMIVHHEGAVEMSEKELAEGKNPQAKALAQSIITAQKSEISEMRSLQG